GAGGGHAATEQAQRHAGRLVPDRLPRAGAIGEAGPRRRGVARGARPRDLGRRAQPHVVADGGALVGGGAGGRGDRRGGAGRGGRDGGTGGDGEEEEEGAGAGRGHSRGGPGTRAAAPPACPDVPC